MLGFSLSKLILTVAVVAVVWWMWRRRVERRFAARRHMSRDERDTQMQASVLIEDLVPCKVCGTYVAAVGARSCGRPDCPAG